MNRPLPFLLLLLSFGCATPGPQRPETTSTVYAVDDARLSTHARVEIPATIEAPERVDYLLLVMVDCVVTREGEVSSVFVIDGRERFVETLDARGQTMMAPNPPLSRATVARAKSLVENAVGTPARLGNRAVDQRVRVPVVFNPERPLDRAAEIVEYASPEYSMRNREDEIEGLVVFEVLVDVDGAVVDMRPDGGPERLIEATEDALNRSQFAPAVYRGEPVRSWTTFSSRFTIIR